MSKSEADHQDNAPDVITDSSSFPGESGVPAISGDAGEAKASSNGILLHLLSRFALFTIDFLYFKYTCNILQINLLAIGHLFQETNVIIKR